MTGGPAQPITPTTPRKPVEAMTSEEVARRREQDLNRETPEGLTAAEQRRRQEAREAYENAGHSHGHYGEAAH